MEDSLSMMLRISRKGEISLLEVQFCLQRMADKNSRNHFRLICQTKRTLLHVLTTESCSQNGTDYNRTFWLYQLEGVSHDLPLFLVGYVVIYFV